MKPIVIIGSGGHAYSVLDAASPGVLRKVGGYVEDAFGAKTKPIHPKYLGPISVIPELAPSCVFVMGIGFVGRGDRRHEVVEILRSCKADVLTVVSGTAYVSPKAVVGSGSVVLHGAIVNVGATIGDFSIVNSRALVEHDVSIGDESHISTGAIINGGAKISERVFIGSGAVVFQKASVLEGAIVPAGSVIR